MNNNHQNNNNNEYILTIEEELINFPFLARFRSKHKQFCFPEFQSLLELNDCLHKFSFHKNQLRLLSSIEDNIQVKKTFHNFKI